MRKRCIYILLFVFFPMFLSSSSGAERGDSISHKSFFKHLATTAINFIDAFNDYDTAYIEPQHYNYAFMMQNTFNYERYELDSKSGQSIVLAPNVSAKIGPYFGWRWLFLGYTFDINHISINTSNSKKKEFDISLYTSMFGVDFFYRRTGSDYKIKRIYLGQGIDTQPLVDNDFKDINIGITGANVYYIFNHRHFSYPAAFSQSTCQKRSAGSLIAGIAYTHHSISLDHAHLQEMINQKLSTTVQLDSGLMFNKVNYTDVSLSVGYAYNWVFSKYWLMCISLSPALAYKYSSGNLDKMELQEQSGFSFRNFNFDLVNRFGIVWNDTKWYGGMSAIMHTYNYNKSQFSTMNVFGSINVYFGLNFGLKNTYKKKNARLEFSN
jgi:hypothetical protein